MRSEIITTTNHPSARSWPVAYVAFLMSPRESLVLKIAPLALIFGFPEVIASNFIPFIGEISDLGELVLAAIVIIRTISVVRKYHRG